MYIGSEGEIARYLGGGDGISGGGSDTLFSSGGGDGEDAGEHVDEEEDEDLDKDLDEEADEDRVCFRHSSRRC